MATLERLTVNLTERSSKALSLAHGITSDTKTDIVNRALQVYAYIVHQENQGREIYSTDADGEKVRLVALT